MSPLVERILQELAMLSAEEHLEVIARAAVHLEAVCKHKLRLDQPPKSPFLRCPQGYILGDFEPEWFGSPPELGVGGRVEQYTLIYKQPLTAAFGSIVA